MVLISKKHIYPHSWERVTTALWNKYPNDLQPHVKRVDILSLKFDHVKKLLYAKRLYSLKYNSPNILEKIIGSSFNGFAIEELKCDFSERELTLKGTNHTFRNMFSIEEICKFKVHPENVNWTLFTQDIIFSFNGLKNRFRFLSRALEKATVQSLNEKSHHGLKVMHQKIEQVRSMFEKEKVNAINKIETPGLSLNNEKEIFAFKNKLFEEIKNLLFLNGYVKNIFKCLFRIKEIV